MAGGKQSPRDRLVGMMYLVLTALLALQVSSAVLTKFILINRSIENAVQYQLSENNEYLQKITKLVRDSGDTKSDIDILNRMVRIRERTDSVIQKLEAFKSTLIKKAGGIPEKKIIKDLRNDAVVGSLMINNNKGKELKKILNDYVLYLKEETGKSYSLIALDAREIDFLKNDPNQGRKSFTMLNFKKTPLAAALATLSQFISEVVYDEADALQLLGRQLGAEDIKVDTVQPYVIPESNIVPSGGKYVAKVILSAYSSTQSSEMTINGRKIPVKDGVGYVDFPVTALKGGSGADEKRSINVSVGIKNRKGETKFYSVKEPYTVTKPVIVIESDAVSALYKNCSNELNVRVPAFGSNYNPKFSVKGGKLIPRGGGKITIIPDENKVTLSVYHKGLLVGNEVFRVRQVPLPTIKVSSRGKVVDEKKGYAAPGPRNLKVSVIPDSSFREFLPKEARYKVSKGNVILARGDLPIITLPIKSASLDLKSVAQKARQGDRIIIEIKEVKRMTAQGTLETVKTGSIIKTIPITK